jgi:hypothetical protein
MTDKLEYRNDKDGYLQTNASHFNGDFSIVLIVQHEVSLSIYNEINAQTKDSS